MNCKECVDLSNKYGGEVLCLKCYHDFQTYNKIVNLEHEPVMSNYEDRINHMNQMLKKLQKELNAVIKKTNTRNQPS